jgi:hypothetical protein
MLLFSPLQVVSDDRLVVPSYIRAALGLHRDIKVYLSTIDVPGVFLQNEIILSPVSIKARDELWRLRVTFVDRPGILAELFRVLCDEKIEVVSCRVHTLEQNRILSVELLLNTELYQSKYAVDTSMRESAAGPTLPDLRARIIGTFINDLDLPFGTKPILSIRHNIPLYRSKAFLKDLERSQMTAEGVDLPTSLMESIRENYAHVYPNTAHLRGSSRLPIASVVGDAENSVLRIIIFYKNTGHAHIRVRASSKGECLLEIAEALRERSFNILQMYTRILRHHEQQENLTDILLHLPPEVDRNRNDAQLQKFITGIFTSRCFKALSCKLTFPEYLASASAWSHGELMGGL